MFSQIGRIERPDLAPATNNKSAIKPYKLSFIALYHIALQKWWVIKQILKLISIWINVYYAYLPIACLTRSSGESKKRNNPTFDRYFSTSNDILDKDNSSFSSTRELCCISQQTPSCLPARAMSNLLKSALSKGFHEFKSIRTVIGNWHIRDEFRIAGFCWYDVYCIIYCLVTYELWRIVNIVQKSL